MIVFFVVLFRFGRVSPVFFTGFFIRFFLKSWVQQSVNEIHRVVMGSHFEWVSPG